MLTSQSSLVAVCPCLTVKTTTTANLQRHDRVVAQQPAMRPLHQCLTWSHVCFMPDGTKVLPLHPVAAHRQTTTDDERVDDRAIPPLQIEADGAVEPAAARTTVAAIVAVDTVEVTHGLAVNRPDPTPIDEAAADRKGTDQQVQQVAGAVAHGAHPLMGAMTQTLTVRLQV